MATYTYPRHSYPRPEPFVLHVTASCPEAKKQHAYAIIHEEIAYLKCVISQVEKEIATLKSSFNALSAIHKLPGEILGHIFLLLAHESQPPTTSWVSITRVCAHWRNTAMNYPEIWSRPDFRNTKRAVEMIKRAKACPLTVDFTMHDITRVVAGSPSPFDILVKSIPQAKQLVFRYCQCHPAGSPASAGLIPDPQAFLKRPAPLLEGLSLTNSPFMLHATLPEGAFSGNIPKLRHISLHNWFLPRTTSSLLPFARITSLNMVVSGGYMRYASADAFLMLRHLTELRNLSITNLLTSTPIGFDTSFELPRLNRLTVFDRCYGCAVFFRSVTYPPTASVEIGFSRIFQLGPDTLLAAETAINQTVRKASNQLPAPISALKIREDTVQQLVEVDVHTNIPWGPDKPKCQLSLQGVPPLTIVSGRLSDLLPLENLTSLVYAVRKSSEELWQNIGQLPNLWSIAVHGNHEGLLTVIGSTKHGTGTETMSGNKFDIHFPSLSVLLLNNWKFWDASDRINENFGMIGTDWFPPPDDHVHLALLTDALLFRRRNEQNFTQVMVISSIFTPEHVAAVEEITGDRTNWFIMEHGLASAFPETIQTPLTSP